MARRVTTESAQLALALVLVACGSADGAHDFHQDAARFNGVLHACPTIGIYTATPMKTGVGSSIQLSSSAGDDEVSPTLSFIWLARAGSFSDPTARDTSYLCQVIGTQTLTLIVTDGVCGDWVEVSVECVAPSG